MNSPKAANKFLKAIKRKVSFEAVENYLKNLGYKVLFFNTPAGDAELSRYSLTQKAQTLKAFTYVSAAKLVFINDELSAEDKLYALLHETAHIELGHMELERLSAHNRILLDIDADSFVYFVLNPVRRTPFYIAVAACLISVLSVSVCIGFFSTAHIPASLSSATAGDEAQIVSYENADVLEEASDEQEEASDSLPPGYVVITKTGTKFHTPDCGNVYYRETIPISRTEAEKLFEPCKRCNP